MGRRRALPWRNLAPSASRHSIRSRRKAWSGSPRDSKCGSTCRPNRPRLPRMLPARLTNTDLASASLSKVFGLGLAQHFPRDPSALAQAVDGRGPHVMPRCGPMRRWHKQRAGDGDDQGGRPRVQHTRSKRQRGQGAGARRPPARFPRHHGWYQPHEAIGHERRAARARGEGQSAVRRSRAHRQDPGRNRAGPYRLCYRPRRCRTRHGCDWLRPGNDDRERSQASSRDPDSRWHESRVRAGRLYLTEHSVHQQEPRGGRYQGHHQRGATRRDEE
mmetsp:Transcript_58082/g.160622  ORF Transcript_58082/g.160622 Transcript_58082/m.160622 type:complete len:274 (-) Transcript_58082:923-1744(-)